MNRQGPGFAEASAKCAKDLGGEDRGLMVEDETNRLSSLISAAERELAVKLFVLSAPFCGKKIRVHPCIAPKAFGATRLYAVSIRG